MGYDNRVIARRYMDEVVSRGNYAVLDEIADEHLIVRDAHFPEGKGFAVLQEHLELFRAGFPDMTFVLDELHVAGDRVIVKWTALGTQRAPFLGLPATNRAVAVKGCELLRIYDGKVHEDDAYWDTYSMFEQLGLIPGMAELAQSKAKLATRAQPHVH
jgi:steroid delta-isomerase-like uncharacterized protein